MEILLKKPERFVDTPRDPSPDGIECDLCENRGYIAYINDEGELMTRPCSCMARRRSVRLAKKSGLADLLARCSFAEFRCPDEWSKQLKAAALRYAAEKPGAWFYVSGRPGTGKTHACTAICSRLMKRGEEVRYLLWREEIPQLKALVNEPEEYKRRMDALAAVPVLYIDDFLKGTVTDADVNLAFSLINARYNRSASRTLFSSELPLSEVRRYDEATGSRIWQRAAGYILNAPPGAKNWRLGD